MSEQNYRFAADPFVDMFELVFKGRVKIISSLRGDYFHNCSLYCKYFLSDFLCSCCLIIFFVGVVDDLLC